MRSIAVRVRTVFLLVAIAMIIYGPPATLRALPVDICDEVCSSSQCGSSCYENMTEFENGNAISCLAYGVYDTNQFCCGDGQCREDLDENTTSCEADCAEPPALEPSTTVLVNGSLTEDATWIYPGAAQFNAVAATYGEPPVSWQWTQNSLFEVVWPYEGIWNGGLELASFISHLPAEDVNVVAHSHGGNVSILSSFFSGRQIKHLVQLGTPVNWDLDRFLGGLGAWSRCQVSSWSDWVQFFGASFAQISGFTAAVYASNFFSAMAAEAAWNNDYDGYLYYTALALSAAWAADEFFASTKIEVDGLTVMFGGVGHSDLHEPGVWNAIAPYCATNLY